MADMYTPEEIQEIFQAYNDAIASGAPITKDLAQQMKDATIGVKNYSAQLKQSLQQLGTSIKTLGKDLYDGKTGASMFNSSISAGADAVDKYASKFGPAGRAVGLMTKAVAAYTGAVSKQADTLYKTYQDISRSGTIASGGMREVYDNMQRFNYGLEEMGKLGSLLSENSQYLAKFGGTAVEGARQFSQLANDIQHSQLGERLLNMGVSVDEINRGVAGFLRQQTMLGMTNTQINKNLNQSTKDYLENLEAVSRLTGQDRKTLEQKREDALAEQQFAAKQYELQQQVLKGGEEGLAAQKQLDKLNFIRDNLSGDMQKDAIRSFAGDVAASGRLMTAFPEVYSKFQDATADGADVMYAYTKGARRNITDMNKAFQYGFGESFLYGFKENAAIVSQFGEAANPEDIRKMMKAAKDASATTDRSTKNMTEMEIAQRKTRDSLNDFMNLGIRPVTDAMKILADVVETLTSFLPGAGAARDRAKREKAAADARSGYKSMTEGANANSVSTQDTLLKKLSSSGITDKKSQANILAQVQRESGGKANAVENLKYTGEQLFKMFPNKFNTVAQANDLAAQGEESVGNYIYGNRMGNKAGEGFKYRGRGLIQLTGRQNYEKYGKLLGVDLVNNPELAAQPDIAEAIAVAYFKEAQLGGTDLSDIKQVNKAVGFVGSSSIKGEAWTRSNLAKEIEKTLPSAASGGVLSGPTSGFQAMLHGTEAVVPLPDGRSIPVTTTASAEEMTMMKDQLSKMDEMISVMKNQLSTQNKLLQYQT
jgi:putative chitinase